MFSGHSGHMISVYFLLISFGNQQISATAGVHAIKLVEVVQLCKGPLARNSRDSMVLDSK